MAESAVSRMELIGTVRILVGRTVEIPAEQLTLESKLGDFELDSLDMIRLSLAFEKDLGVKFSAAELSGMITFGDLIEGIESKSGIAKRLYDCNS
jgi:acyl carrier protein